jgi:hypothetical protein
MIKRLLTITVLSVLIVAAFISSLTSQPSFNGATPGCGSGGGCHTPQTGIVSAVPSGMQVQITLTGATSSVAGELVDSTGTVVAVNNSTGNNPFTLTAPGPGRYTVNAGFKNPSRQWGTTEVDIVVTGVDEGRGGLPGTYRLEQNYPNPFNPSTTIAYSIPERAHVSLKVYDMSGREVATLVDRMEGAGPKTVKFDAVNLATGSYLYRLVAGDFSETRHFVVMR